MIWTLIILSLGLASAKKREYVNPQHLNHLRATGQDEEFARLLGVDVKFVRRDSEERSEGSIYNHVSRWGDILLPEEDEETGRVGINFWKYRGSCWGNRQIPYEISEEFSDREKALIHGSLASLSDRLTNVKIVNRTWESDYIFIMDGDGCWSYFGRRGGQQAVSLDKSGCINSGTVQHEIMHALGIAHEHCRQDRDDYVDVLWDNIEEDWHSQYEKVDEDDFLTVGTYDYKSVMHYRLRAPTSNKPAFRILRENVTTLGQYIAATDSDVSKIDELYEMC